MYAASYDKPHRCPKCWTIPDVIYENHHSARLWYVYTCRNEVARPVAHPLPRQEDREPADRYVRVVVQVHPAIS